MEFNKLGLKPWIVKQLTKLNLKKPTPVQEKCIPEILNGKDVIASAKTGEFWTVFDQKTIIKHFFFPF